MPDPLPDLTTDDESDDDLDPVYKHHLAELDNDDDAKQWWHRVSTICI